MASSRQRAGRIVLLIVLLLTVVLVAVPWAVRQASSTAWDLGPGAETGLTRYLGRVTDTGFQPLTPRPFGARFTRIAMQEARSPDSAELDLQPFREALVVIEGRDAGGWIYSASVVQKVDNPLLVLLVRYAWTLGPGI